MNRVEPGVPVPNVIVILLLLAGLNPIACSCGESPHQNSNARPNGSITQRTQLVLDGGRLLQNENPQGDASGAAAKKAGRSPKVVGQICQQVGWTRQVSQALQADQIQSVQVQHMADPPSPPQQTVKTKIDNGQQNVEINPGDPKMVYVPQHNPVTIDNTPASSAPTQTTTADTTTAQTTSSPEKSGVSTGTAVVASLRSPGVVRTVGAGE
ncbi:MAG TPA: DUF3300 domain-containing protein [Terriglobales bacterium]|nr:DUF3300 domain-containing protein [Terriglobales bacterium]